MKFPYISQIHVNDCYAYQNFDIPSNPLLEFKHIILTGRNGSGKTTILSIIAQQFNEFKSGRTVENVKSNLELSISYMPTKLKRETLESQLKTFSRIDLIFFKNIDNSILTNPDEYIFSFFKANRKVSLKQVTTISTETNFEKDLKTKNNSEEFYSLFKQYLVNKKVYEAFDVINGKSGQTNQNKIFFDNLTNILRNIFRDKELKLEFIQEKFEFYIVLHDGRKVTFNQLPEGFSAFLSILMDLLMRADLMRKSIEDFTYNPYGVVLIDEPETHFHIAMQYEILPLLINSFPNIQFVIATHSPAVISSIKDALVYDISSKKEISGWQAGSSYSELMIKHFGLENEFSPVADKLLLEVSDAVQKNDTEKLKELIRENEQILTPSLKFEIESNIIAIESKRSNYD